MTEPADAPGPATNPPPGPTGDPDNVLETFKADVTETDNDNVHDAIGGRPRLNWSPVTDGGGRAPTDSADVRSSFHFDLGGALARLGEQPGKPAEDSAPPAAAAPAPAAPAAFAVPVAPVADRPLPQRAPVAPPTEVAPVVDQGLRQRSPAAPAAPIAPVTPVTPVTDHPLPQRGSVAPVVEPPAAPLLE